MQSILISSRNKQKIGEELEKILRELNINKFDRTIFEFEKAVGIPDIRELQKKIYLRPFKSNVRAIVIDITSGITVEAQNALLKTLEEAPTDTIIILLSQNADELLPTIISRCKVLEVKTKKEAQEIQGLTKVLNYGVEERLKLAQDLAKDKKEALDFLESLIIELRKNLVLNYKKLKYIQKIHTTIKGTNVNLRLALENLFLNL